MLPACPLSSGFVNVDSEKMSKSLGNFFTIREVRQRETHARLLVLLLTLAPLPQPLQPRSHSSYNSHSSSSSA